MQIPNEIQLVKVGGSEPLEGEQPAGWYQHHRNEDAHVGVVSRCYKRGAPTIQSWYCDYIIGSTFNTLQDMQRAALVVADKEAKAILDRYPVLSEVTPVTQPAAGHAVPRCSLYPNEPATHVGVLVRSWNNDWNMTVFLGAKAMGRVKKKEPVVWVLDVLNERAAARIGVL